MNFHNRLYPSGKTFLLFIVAFLLSASLLAQDETDGDKKVETKYINWHNKDEVLNGVPGISTERAYNELLKGKKSQTVIVAVIDGGVDTAHEALKGKIWTNEKEIPGNGIDDDHNGFVDDVHGWNFLGNSKGENIEHETLELTRLYKKYSDRFGTRSKREVAENEKHDYKEYEKIAAAYLKELISTKENVQLYTRFLDEYCDADSTIKKYLKREDYTQDDLKAVRSSMEEINQAATTLMFLKEADLTKSKLAKLKQYEQDKLDYNLNPDYDPHRDIIGGDPEKMNPVGWTSYGVNDIPYGNNDVMGPNPSHGTFVAGIIAAGGSDSIKAKGIAENVKIMPIRAIPDGDEYDKDVANAIRYAADNGAQIINLSFGKEYSPQKQFVDDAIRYAEKKGILFVQAAGNDSHDVDETPNFPTHLSADNSDDLAPSWITTGALTKNMGNYFVASFSNYGRKTVDLFAPGVLIYGLKPHNKYELGDGTSYAAPMVTGAAALLKSYFPQLTAQQIKGIITQSGTSYKKLRVHKPSKEGKSSKKKFFKLSASGSELNVYNAVKMAQDSK